MGSLTANRKRHSYIDASPPDSHVSKKLKSSSTIHISSQTLGTSNSTISRLSRYPQTTTKFNREVHAPCRISRFTRLKIGSKGEGFYGYNDVTSSLFIKTQRFVHRSSEVKEVIDVDKVVDERIVVEEDGKEGDSMDYEFVDERIGVEEDGKVGDLMELEPNCCDEGVDKEDDNEVKIMEERSVVTSDVENVEKPVDLLVVDRGIDLLSAEVYKQLLASAERRDVRLKELEFQTQLYERKRSLEQSLRPIKKPEEKLHEETSHAPFIPLTKEEEAEVNRAFSAVNRRKGLVSHKNSCIDITGEILQCLRPGQWLNDEVINLYLELLKEREKREPEKFLRCHFFSTFFYKKLTSGNKNVYDYRAVRRWTTERKLGYFLMDCDKIFVPVHFREMHWCMAIINKKDQKFQYLDSLKARDFKVLKNLAKYYVEEVKDKCKKDIDVSNWEHEFLEDLPQQENGFDCGVFMIKYADFISRGLGLCFGQEHMPYFRLRTAKEILRLRAD